MSELIVLCFGVAILLTISYLFSQDDFFSPSLIICAIFFLSTILAIRDVIAWYVSESMFTTEATMLLLLGLTMFVVAEQFVKVLLKTYTKKAPSVESFQKIAPIHPPRVRKILLLIIMGAIVLYYCYMTYKYTIEKGYLGVFNFSQIAAYRHHSTFSTDSVDTSRLYRFSKYFIDANVFVSIWILVRNIIYAQDTVKNNITYIATVLLSIPTFIINSSRGSLLHILGSSLFVLYIMMRRKKGWKKPGKTFRKILFWSMGILVVALVLFYYIQVNGVFGRLTDRSLLDHVTMYLGDPILNFYDYIKNPPNTPIIYFGQETFAGLNNLFISLHIRDTKYTAQLEFRTIQGHSGNIYTFFRRPLRDFGVIGMCIIAFMTSFAFSYIYYKKLYKKNESYRTDLTLILYSYFFYIIYLVPMLCQLCNMIIFGAVYFAIFVVLIYRAIIGKSHRIRFSHSKLRFM